MSKRARRDSVVAEDAVVELPHTPAPLTNVSRVVSTPTRRSRLEEKHHLQSLNKRLEYYIFCQRERDASTSHIRDELNKLREQSQNDLDELRNFYESNLNTNVSARDNLAVELTKFKDEAGRTQRELSLCKSELDSVVTERDMLDEQLVKRNDEVHHLSANVMALEDRVTSNERELALLKQKLADTEDSLKEARTAAATAAKQLSEEQLLVKHLNADLDLTAKKFQDEIDHYQLELSDLNKERATVEDELRTEFGSQLQDLLAERQSQFEQEKVELAKDLREAFDTKMSQYITDFEDMKVDLSDALKVKTGLENREKEHKIKLIELETTNQAYKGEINLLKEQLADQSVEHDKRVDNLMTRFNELSDMFQAKEDEFNTLMDVKITLAMEIKAYRSLLDKEETRMGYSSFNKSQPVDQTEKILIVGLDLDGNHIRMKNGATEPINLGGWKISSTKTLREYTFDDIDIDVGKTFTVFFGKDAKSRLENNKGLSFAVTDLFAPSGDSGVFTDNLGRVVQKIEFLSK